MMTRLYTREGSVGDLPTVDAISFIAEVPRYAWDPVTLEGLIRAIDDACRRSSVRRPALRKALRDRRKRQTPRR